MIVRAHMTLPDLTPDDARDVRAAVDAWATGRPHLERPEVLYVVAPAVAEDALTGADWTRLQRWVTCSVVDPSPADLVSLGDVLGPFAWPDLPVLNVTRDPEGLDA